MATGIAFELPGKVTKATQAAAGPEGQSYQVRSYTGTLSADVGCSVSVETSLSGQLDVVVPAKLPGLYESQFKNAGSTDVTASAPVPVLVEGNAGVDFQLTFTAGDGSHVLWLFRVINGPQSQEILQSFSSDLVTTTPSELTQLNAHLTASLRYT